MTTNTPRKETNMKETHSIAILGGSFNPPTRAHAAVLAHAMKESGADRGLLVPSSDLYVRKKLERHKKSPDSAPGVIPFDARMLMCQSYADTYNESHAMDGKRMSASPVERHGNAWGNTCVMLEAVRDNNPGARLLFIIGDDKLRILHKWGNIGKLLSQFEMLVLPREKSDGKAIRDAIMAFPETADYADRFTILPPCTQDIGDISSTAFWKSFLSKEPHPAKMPDYYTSACVADMAARWHTDGKQDYKAYCQGKGWM